MTEHFFTGGTMPSADLLLYFQRDLKIKQQWWVNGMHYGKTCEDWLTTMLSNEKSIKEGLKETYGEEGSRRGGIAGRYFIWRVRSCSSGREEILGESAITFSRSRSRWCIL